MELVIRKISIDHLTQLQKIGKTTLLKLLQITIQKRI